MNKYYSVQEVNSASSLLTKINGKIVKGIIVRTTNFKSGDNIVTIKFPNSDHKEYLGNEYPVFFSRILKLNK